METAIIAGAALVNAGFGALTGPVKRGNLTKKQARITAAITTAANTLALIILIIKPSLGNALTAGGIYVTGKAFVILTLGYRDDSANIMTNIKESFKCDVKSAVVLGTESVALMAIDRIDKYFGKAVPGLFAIFALSAFVKNF